MDRGKFFLAIFATFWPFLAPFGKGYQIGHSFFVPSNGQKVTAQWLKQVFQFEIKPLLEEYYCDDPAIRSTALDIVMGTQS